MMRAVLCGVLVAMVGAVLSELGWHGKKLFGVLGTLLLLSLTAEGAGEVFREITVLADDVGIADEARIILKTIGTGYVFGIASDICSELGEGAVSGALVTAGRLEMLLLAMPYITDIISAATELIG